jgi:hypothetical protein
MRPQYRNVNQIFNNKEPLRESDLIMNEDHNLKILENLSMKENKQKTVKRNILSNSMNQSLL